MQFSVYLMFIMDDFSRVKQTVVSYFMHQPTKFAKKKLSILIPQVVVFTHLSVKNSIDLTQKLKNNALTSNAK